MFEKDLSLSVLYDVYSPLLTEKQKKAFEEYFCEDLSLAEIAEETGTSRQAVRNLIARTAAELSDFENKLGLLRKQSMLEKLADELETADKDKLKKISEELRDII